MKKFHCLFTLLLFTSIQVFAENDELIELTRVNLSLISENKIDEIENLQIKSCGVDCVSFESSLSELEFKIQISSALSSPEIESGHRARTLHLPSMEILNLTPSDSMRSAFKSWLIGHELHPYMGFSKPKTVQTTALRASHTALEQGALSLLHIAPTAVGKTWVLIQTLLKQMRDFSKKKIFIVTAHQLQLIDQLSSQLKTEYEQQRDFHVVDWRNIVEKNWQSFAVEIKHASNRQKPTVLVITSQSLKRRLPEFFTQTEKQYKDLQNTLLSQLGSVYIDEAHHLGAYQTKSTLLKLLADSRKYQREQESKRETFLYGTTATPVHPEVNLRDFFEREHWAYLNTEQNLFATHNVESVLKQLAIGIDRGELTPFDDLYIIGEKSFKDLSENVSDNLPDNASDKNQSVELKQFAETTNNQESSETPIFIQGEDSAFYVLNPDYYEPLLRIISPILESNQKGFIVTATIAEAERLQAFLNQSTTNIKFEAYHSQMEDLERRDVLNRSRYSTGSHYIIAVRALDEGVDLPHLSTYIDLNLNISIHQMIHRIGRVLRLYPSKQTADILFLINYRNEQLAKDALSILEQLESLSFSRGSQSKESGDIDLRFSNTGIKPLSRAELQEMRDRLPEYIRQFWAERYYTLEEIPAVVARHNENAPPEKQITSQRTYEDVRKEHEDPKLPSWGALQYWYAKEHDGTTEGLTEFITGTVQPELYSLNEVRDIVLEHNENAPPEKQITSQRTYEDVRKEHEDPKLPSWGALQYWYAKEHDGATEGLTEFITGKIPKSYSLSEVPDVVSRHNENAPAEKQITSQSTYEDVRKNKDYEDLRLPPWGTLSNWYQKKHGTITGLPEFIRTGTVPESKPELYSLEEIPSAVSRLNEKSPESEQIISSVTYHEFHHNDPKLPSWITLYNWFKKKHKKTKGLTQFILTGTTPEPKPEPYSLNEIPNVVSRHNESTPAEKQITSQSTYEDVRKKHEDPKLPPWSTLVRWYKKKHGTTKGLPEFIRTGTTPELPPAPCENQMLGP